MYPERMIFIGAIVFAFLVLFNLIYLDYKVNNLPTQTVKSLPSPYPREIPASNSAVLTNLGCDLDCQTVFQEYIDKQVASAKSDLLKVITSTTNTTPLLLAPTPSPSQSSNLLLTLQPQNYYVDLGGEGSTLSNDWVDADGLQIRFSSSQYPGAKGFYFQANLRTDAPNQTSYVRLYNNSSNTEISGSDLNYTGDTANFKETSSLTLPATDTIIKVQIHGTNNTRAYVDNPKIRIAY